MHNFFTPKEFTPLGGLTSKDLTDSQGLPGARASARLKISGNSLLSCCNYDLVRKNQEIGEPRVSQKKEKNSRGKNSPERSRVFRIPDSFFRTAYAATRSDQSVSAVRISRRSAKTGRCYRAI